MLPVTKRAIPLGLCRAHAQPKDRWAEGVKAVSRRRRWRAAPALRPAVHRSTKIQLLPGDEFLLPPSPSELTAKPGPGRANFVFAKLDASHGRQDHTVLPYATTSLVLRRSISHSFRRPAISLPRNA